MKCEICGKRVAQIQLQQKTQGKEITHYLCITCAKDKGIENVDGKVQFNLGQIMNSLNPHEDNSLDKCPGCQQSVEDIKKNKEVGCPLCYLFFRNEIKDLLHKHNGLVLKYKGIPDVRQEEITKLEHKLTDLIEKEMYEEAALIRDKIQELKHC
ncbi:UvrB/UvrC motif-containing protein [Spirochaeta cellobiosiphila]|uniref:UvrB/UvrC motif-containing protein n=1 Tax=Spirochaeta cellobiosiphila TaxID=504483 RepID=UPI00040C1935|nr:UvrB/UvrC motif-containing protein [Spirochaeta cellobiosiphila]